MQGETLLTAGVIYLVAAVLVVPIAARLGIGAVLGYLLAGIAIGPWGWASSAMWTRFCTSRSLAWCS